MFDKRPKDNHFKPSLHQTTDTPSPLPTIISLLFSTIIPLAFPPPPFSITEVLFKMKTKRYQSEGPRHTGFRLQAEE